MVLSRQFWICPHPIEDTIFRSFVNRICMCILYIYICIILLWLFNYCILELQCNSECSPSEVRPLSSIIWLWGNMGFWGSNFNPFEKPKNLGIAPEEEIPIIWEEVIFLHFDVSIPGCVGSYKLRFNLQGNNVAMTKLIVGMVLMLGLQHAKQERPKRCTSVSSGLKTWMILWKNGIILHEGDGGFVATGFTPAPPPNVLTEGSCFNLHFDQKVTRQLKKNMNLGWTFAGGVRKSLMSQDPNWHKINGTLAASMVHSGKTNMAGWKMGVGRRCMCHWKWCFSIVMVSLVYRSPCCFFLTDWCFGILRHSI